MGCLIQTPVDLRHFLDPELPFPVLQLHDLLVRPVKVEGYVGYLLEQPGRGVAYASPAPVTSTSNLASQSGHLTPTRACPFSFTRR